MDKQEKELEKKIMNHLSRIEPRHSLFEDTMNKFVTSRPVDRSNKEKASVLSFYQLINNFIMISKKNILIGIPVAVFVLVAIILTTKSGKELNQVAINQTPTLQEEIVQTNNLVKEDLSSIDSIVASFKNDADVDAMIAASEFEDTDTLIVELQDYNKIKIYEDTL
jgi:hypothetical protein